MIRHLQGIQEPSSGNVFDAPVNGAKIRCLVKDGKAMKGATALSNAFGDYKVEFESSSICQLYIIAPTRVVTPIL
ncbi:hypothetical protein [Vibrio parahaemolyticus]|uniref:hypothetical protein n=1 Tax=Vibrio parahaemolyticus TaxID=670 RepID=UPI0025555048|nr:hypothetical protein [Vibrio parahaemolyticus]MDK9517751.1 hypothetical protein [Vibrio parahaemolyticus]